MKEFIEFLLTQIVKHPEELEVTESGSDGYVDIKIKAASDDMGIIIGKEGRTIRSIRSLAKAKAIKENVRVNVEIVEPEEKPTFESDESTEEKPTFESNEETDAEI